MNDKEKNRDLLTLNKRQTNIAFAGVIVLLAMAFIGGYIVGLRKALHEFSDRLAEESFTDKIRYALYSSYGTPATTPGPETEDGDEVDKDGAQSEEKNQDIGDTEKEIEEKIELVESPSQTEDEVSYYAQLIGFGTLKAAERFVEDAKKEGFKTTIVKKVSKTSRGKTIYWYQVITERFTNKEELLRIVERIQFVHRLQQVKIIEE